MSEGGERPVALFDLDGTLAASNVVRPLVWLALAERRGLARAAALALLVPRIALCALLDLASRRLFNLVFYRLYRAIPPERARGLAARCAFETIVPRLFPDMVERVARHRALGHAVAIVSGGLDFLVAPIAERLGADAFAAASLEERGGRFTGRLRSGPLAGAAKAEAARALAARRGYDLGRSFAYADHPSDVPFLEVAARPHAVRPHRSLAREAARRGWPVIGPA